ncbi:hypothetical protein TWF506_009275 [Arthrobotrys conoides]|uniref:Uncharacterized protein n=1 Tax=Arthrobotrys conoides TaxID=74498 RepID=A0AAN8NKK8_9PEZI
MTIAEEDAKITITILNRGGVLRIFGSVTRRVQPLVEVSGNPTKSSAPPPPEKPSKLWKTNHQETGENSKREAATLDLSGHPRWTAINSPLGKRIEAARYNVLELCHQSSSVLVAPQSVDKFSQRRRKWRSNGSNEEPAPKKRKYQELLPWERNITAM